MKEIIITTLTSTLLFGSAIPVSLNETIAQEEAYFKENGTYYADRHDSLEVVEYVTPKGEAGYQIIAYDENGNRVSVGYGPEAESRTFSYVFSTASSTPAE